MAVIFLPVKLSLRYLSIYSFSKPDVLHTTGRILTTIYWLTCAATALKCLSKVHQLHLRIGIIIQWLAKEAPASLL